MMVDEVRALPNSSEESEAFFNAIIENFDGSREECLAYIKAHLKEWYLTVGGWPTWLQDPEWPFYRGKPMLFVGEVDRPRGTPGWPFDHGCFYVFYSPDFGETVTVLQHY